MKFTKILLSGVCSISGLPQFTPNSNNINGLSSSLSIPILGETTNFDFPIDNYWDNGENNIKSKSSSPIVLKLIPVAKPALPSKK